ncbi:hypothetical protein PsAD5_02430 [Pseudovibrio sp. Ad5]|nr:hypothetical protein PsAD5_02430 [Pseudovibrio sp. Ad5]
MNRRNLMFKYLISASAVGLLFAAIYDFSSQPNNDNDKYAYPMKNSEFAHLQSQLANHDLVMQAPLEWVTHACSIVIEQDMKRIEHARATGGSAMPSLTWCGKRLSLRNHSL